MKRARYSLLTLLLTTTIAALVLSLYLARTQLHKVQTESDRLKNQLGELKITDATQVHLIAVPTAEAMNWRWRVHLPGGTDFGLFVYRGKLSEAGLPPADAVTIRERIGGQTNPNEAREILIDVAWGKTLEGDPCLWISENGRSGAPVTFDSELPSWARNSVMFSERIAGASETIHATTANPLGLIALDGVDEAGMRCNDAVLIWIGVYEKTPTQSLRDRGVLP